MGDIDNCELRKLAEPYKSFPKAVAAVVRAMFDQGTKYVKIVFGRDNLIGSTIEFFGTNTTFDEGLGNFCLLHKFFEESDLVWALAFVHHSMGVYVYDSGYRFMGVGLGDGVNPKQDRSAKRLLRELPKLLSPREAFYTKLIDEADKTHLLVKNLPSVLIDGYRVDWPAKLVGYSPDGLVLKLGAVLVPMKTFLKRVRGLSDDYRGRLEILTHPWLTGVVEVRPDETVGIMIPTQPAADFDDTFYTSGQAQMIAMALLEANVYLVAQDEIGKVVESAISGFTDRLGELVFSWGHYRVSRLCPGTMLEKPGNPVLWWNEYSPEGVDELFVDVTHPVFRTIDTYDQTVMQVIWWQVAMWIASSKPDVCDAITDPQARVTTIYLGLREQNPECWDD